MPRKTSIPLFSLLLFAAAACPAQSSVQSPESIRGAVVKFLTSKIQHERGTVEIRVTPVDGRLRLARCQQDLDVFIQSGGIRNGTASVGVRCRGDKPWTIFASAVIKRFEEVVVVARPLERGAIITTADLSLEVHDVSRINGGYFTSLGQAMQKQAKRPLLPGSVLLDSAVDVVKWVKRGQQVTIVAQSAALDIRMTGQALMDGGEGQRIRVRNEKSKRVIEGMVTAPGLVQVAY